MNGIPMKRLTSLIGTVLFSLTVAGALVARPVSSPAQAGFSPVLTRLSPDLRSALAQLPSDEMLTVIITFEEQVDVFATLSANPSEGRLGIVNQLQSQARSSQRELVDVYLSKQMAQGKAEEVTPFWIFNGMAVTASREVIEALAGQPGVLSIAPERLIPAPQALPGSTLAPGAAAAQAQQNLNVVHAQSLWDLGFRGQGVVIASMDTGVSLEHPDLTAQWRGGSNSWYDPYGEHPDTPTDINGHGTWTMGVMVGQNHSGAFVGVAPEAQWIAVKIFNDAGMATTTAIHLGFQWLLDPDGDPSTDDAPHVVNNSWSFLTPGCFTDFQSDLRALRAAGILPIFAAGNSGPNLSSSVSPSNYPEAFAVGAVNNSSVINTSSSRGPNTCGSASETYPQIVAPGVNIFSTGLFGGYMTATGTSMAAPHASGALALLLSAFPDLPLDRQEAALLQSAIDIGVPGPDNDTGNGLLDVMAAYEWLQPVAIIPGTGGSGLITGHQVFLPALPVTR